MLASSISGKTLDELIGEDVRQHRRTKRMIGTVIGVLTFLLAFSILISIIATKANRSLQSKIDMIESVFPFFNIPVTETSQDFKETGMEEDGEKSFFRRLWSSIRTNFTMPVEMETWVKWGPDRLVVADDCHDYYKKGVDLDLDCPKIRTDFDQDGLRTDIPGLNAMARTLVRSLNNGRFLQMLSRNSENDSIDRFSEVDEGTVSEVGEETVGEIMNFAMILLPDRLLKQVDMRIRGDQSRKFDPSTHHYLNIWRYPLQSAREESELILMALMDTGYIGSGVSTELILGFLRIGERYELIMAMDWEAAGRIAIYDAGRGNMPQIFTIGMAQAGIPEQSRYMACYNFDRTKFYYEPYLSGSVTSYDSHADQKVPKQLEPMKRIDRGVDSYK
jgi:hypothetical protein